MAKFVLIYRGGGMPESEEEGQKQMAAWGAWFGTLGDAVVDMGNPFGASKSVGGGNGGSTATGYSIVSAGSLDDAVGLANGCPILQNNGSVEVYEAMEM
jgi:hypothetical protein